MIWRHADVPPLEWFVGRADVVHGTNFVVPPARRAAEVVTVHDLTPVRFPEMCQPASLAYPDLIRRAARRGAWIHTHTEFIAAEVTELLGIDRARVVAVASGVPPLPPAAPPGSGPRPGLRPAQPYILAIGTIEPRKDYPTLIAAFDCLAAIHPDVRLVIAGADGWGSEAVTTVIAGSPHRDRILRPGYLDAGQLAGLLRGASVLAYPSRYEGFGYPPLQAMAAGVPVVATRAGCLVETIGDAALMVDVGDTDALAQGLSRVLEDQAVRAQLVAAGTARAAGYTWERCATGLVGIYRQAAADHREARVRS
jgi:glycosyltransferase involved in cell wall biosynthesis